MSFSPKLELELLLLVGGRLRLLRLEAQPLEPHSQVEEEIRYTFPSLRLTYSRPCRPCAM